MQKYVIMCIISASIGAYITYTYAPQIKERVVTHNQVVTVVKEVRHPDGTVETDTRTTDNSVKVEDKRTVASKQWLLSAGISQDRVYYGALNRRLVGPLYAGVWATSNQQIGLSIGVEF